MDNKLTNSANLMTDPERKKANEDTIKFLWGTMRDGRVELIGLSRKLSTTYWIVIVLSIVMFILGIVLLSVPVVASFKGQIGEAQSLISGGFGITDLALLFLFRPIERIHDMMGDMSQIIVAINSYQTLVSLRLMEMDIDIRTTIGEAAEKINVAAKESIKMVQDYFESKGTA